MDTSQISILFAALFLGIALFLLAKILLRYKSLRGMLLGGELVQSLGEVTTKRRWLKESTIRVHLIKDPEGSMAIGLEIVHKGLLSYQLVPATLSLLEARRLGELLESGSR